MVSKSSFCFTVKAQTYITVEQGDNFKISHFHASKNILQQSFKQFKNVCTNCHRHS